jgi:response regulator RpfG family c-di-GMP phosphodiesterase
MKILIIDDEPIKIELFEAFISANCSSFHLDRAISANVFRSKLNTEYDIVLCDMNLAGENGEIILNEYQTAWPNAICFLYSGASTEVNLTVPRHFKCYSIDAVKTQLLIAIISDSGEFTMPPPTPRTMPTYEDVSGKPYNKELCDTRHTQNEKDHDRIETRQCEIVETMNEIRSDLKTGMDKIANKFDTTVKEISEKFDASNAQGRNTFWAMIILALSVIIMPIAYKLLF